MNEKTWKTLAIVFIVLFVIQLLGVVGLFMIGAKSIEMETECAYEVCSEQPFYHYDDYTGVCSCVNSNDEVVFTKVME